MGYLHNNNNSNNKILMMIMIIMCFIYITCVKCFSVRESLLTSSFTFCFSDPFTPVGFPIDGQNRLALDRVKPMTLSGLRPGHHAPYKLTSIGKRTCSTHFNPFSFDKKPDCFERLKRSDFETFSYKKLRKNVS